MSAPGTMALLRQLRAAELAGAMGCQGGGCGCAGCSGGYGCADCSGGYGSSSTGWSSYAEGVASRVNHALERAAALPAELAGVALGRARRVLLDSQADLLSASRAAVATGAHNAGVVLGTMSTRAADAVAALGDGAGAAWRAFWGMPPIAVLGGAALLGTAVLLTLALSPAGQVYLAAFGTGLGSAVASTGAGAGAGMAGAPASLASLATLL